MSEKESNEELNEEKQEDITQEDEDEDVVTGTDIVKALEERDIVEKGLYGNQDGSVCTWPEGYKPRQPLFACLTCCPEEPAGVCLGCATFCHEGHELVELYSKRKFQCDCGNSKFPADKKCTLYEEKKPKNEFNCYNHNFLGKYCTCEDTYPGNLEESMFQCIMCEDWFHLSHQNVEKESETWKVINEQLGSMICCECSTKYPFLAIFSRVTEKTCFPKEIEPVSGLFYMTNGWRERICSCSSCMNVLEKADCTFLLDKEDDIEEFEKKNIESAKDISDEEIVNELTELGGRDAAINVIRGFHEMKQGLLQFVQSKGDQVITPNDIHSFFDQIKRPRLDPEADE